VDETQKLGLYEREGVREYWLLDPDRRTARAYCRDGGRLVPLPDLSAAAGDILETSLVPGLVIPLAKVFR
jgi:Uma2 family endonuclease